MVALLQKRIRRHCNPFHVRHLVTKPEWNQVFTKIQPIEVELGFGKGGFLIDRAIKHPERNFVGIEIRGQLVDLVRQYAIEKQIPNVHFIFGNIHLIIETLFDVGSIQMFHLHFPDPWFKNRHKKRRMLNPKMILLLSDKLQSNGSIFIQTDVKALAEEMDQAMHNSRLFAKTHSEPFMKNSPFDSFSDWEQYHQKRGNPIYRALYTKVSKPDQVVRYMT